VNRKIARYNITRMTRKPARLKMSIIRFMSLKSRGFDNEGVEGSNGALASPSLVEAYIVTRTRLCC
jgi:hypothetical protein